MDYEIYSNDVLIAQFENDSDRDLCLDCLKEAYSDCEFTTE